MLGKKAGRPPGLATDISCGRADSPGGTIDSSPWRKPWEWKEHAHDGALKGRQKQGWINEQRVWSFAPPGLGLIRCSLHPTADAVG